MSESRLHGSRASPAEAEVVVVGGGPSGSAAAAALAEVGRDVLVVDQNEFPRDKPCGDGLTHSAVAMLEDLGLGSVVESGHIVDDVRIVVAHGTESKGWYRAPGRGAPRSKFMRTLPRRTLDTAMLDAALERGARFMRARVDEPIFEADTARGVRLSEADGGHQVAARAVVAADGATSRMRRVAGIGADRPGAPVYAVRQYLTTAEALDPVFDVYVPLAYEGGLLAGYGWVFPIAEHRANVGVAYYSPPAGCPRARIRRVLSAFVEELQGREGQRFGNLTEPSEPIGSPIAVQFSAERCQLENLILCGEAAFAADPLTGEGISFAIGSGHAAARVADRILRSERTPQVGRIVGRRFPRLGQDLSLLARIGIGAEGFKLAESDHQPFVQAVRRVTAGPPEEPSLEATEVRAILGDDPECADAIDRVNERLLDSLRTSIPFGLESVERDVRAGGGPVAAACAISVARACGGDVSEATIRLAATAELVTLVDSCLSRLSLRVRSDLAWLNNTMALLLGDLALTAALRSPQGGRAAVAGEVGAAVRRIAEGEMIDAEDRYDVERGVERCMTALDARAGTLMSLAARLGAISAGRGAETHAWGRFGRQLGIAYQLSEDIRELTVGDQVIPRRPGSDLREGKYTLPLVLALGVEDELRDELRGEVRGRSVPDIVNRVRETGALEEAAAACRMHVDLATDEARRASGDAGGRVPVLADFPVRRLEGLVGRAIADATTTR